MPSVSRDELVEMLEEPGAYRDMERGAVSFWEFYEFLCDTPAIAARSATSMSSGATSSTAPMPGAEELLERVRERYRVALHLQLERSPR